MGKMIMENHDFPSLVGMIIKDRYTLLREEGMRGKLRTFLAMEQPRNKAWSIEVYTKKEDGSYDATYESTMREAQLLMKLKHPGLPYVDDVIENEEYLFVVKEYYFGQTLDSVLTESGPISDDYAIRITEELCNILHYLHTQNPPYIHGDIKPENVFIKEEGTVLLRERSCEARYGQPLEYMRIIYANNGYDAPEQKAPMGKVDARTDIFGLGMTLYNLLTGVDLTNVLEPIKPINLLRPDLSLQLEYIINKCTEVAPDNRFQSVADLLPALCGGDIGYPPPPKSLIGKIFERIRRR